ncbi:MULTISPECIES: PadR family transcriptional regulator [Microbacteriaceae]|jgi:DNA-binding PadR family transcriptional regulator|uniref:PadR family transcriptional regulator n=1 Tax=Orlajensenia leifsoniae TaxID=2561933 RepID=A0A4Y9QU70_9MICO|nr:MULTISPECIES: PadR family transcriptional regulator [Leifsonia]KQQ93698.1 PadR family transcriptional regulator [Leifsonia sp. Leaf325]TFV95298.1 PadR family transcriptional regulator [Leifsonia flava]
MTPPVFAHGNLRLYLLSLLAEQPRHGYELITALSDRFGGTYSPSAGTIYPRLAKLEEEGLVTKSTDGRKTVYEITDAGRAELAAREPELAGIEDEVTDSVRRLADEVRSEVSSAMKSLRADLASAARDARRSGTTTRASDSVTSETNRAVRDADVAINEFRQQLRTDLRLQAARGGVTDANVNLLRQRLVELRTEFVDSLPTKD